MSSPPERQSDAHLAGEVRFRRFHERGADPWLLDYVRRSVEQRTGLFTYLLLRGRDLSPFIELGCETAANGLTLVGRLGQRGISADISLAALRAVDAYRRELGFSTMPLRVCCDVNDLPVRSGSLAFALSWGTMHHFPDPRVPLAETYRALRRGGLLYFDGEPVRRLLSLNLRATRAAHAMNPLARLLLRLRLLPWLFAVDGAEAIEAGALEMKFSAWEWKRFLPEVFEEVRFRWRAYLTGEMRSVSGPTFRLLARLLGAERAEKAATALFGGVVSGEATKCPDLPGRVLPSAPGTLRLALKKPQGHARLRLRFAQASAGTGPEIRVGSHRLVPAADEEEGRVRLYDLPPYHAADGVVEVEVPLEPGLAVEEISSDGPHGPVRFAPHAPGPVPPGDLEDLLACPSCRLPDGDRPPVSRRGDTFTCEVCGADYPIVDGIPILVTPTLARRLGYRA